MGSIGSPKTWIPYMNTKDCSQGFCSLSCPQWCYLVFPPPPPFPFPDDNSTPNFSPLVVAIIGILASVFLLVSYYAIISKYCGNTNSSPSRARQDHDDQELGNNQNPTLHEPWHVSTNGLDEALINSITVFKYKKGDCLVEETECSVCLSEFHEDETLRLLPKCTHAFHVPCIDTWLQSHSNCPLCRANIIFISPSPPQLPPPANETPQSIDSLPNAQQTSDNVDIPQDRATNVGEEETSRRVDVTVKPGLRVFSDLGILRGRDTVIEVRDAGFQRVRRSMSMDHSRQSRLLVTNALRLNREESVRVEARSGDIAGPSKRSPGEDSKSSSQKKGVLHCVMSHVAMKRSFSSGRFLFTRQGRVQETTLPI